MGMFDFLGQSSQSKTSTPWKPQADQLETAFTSAGDWLKNTQGGPNQAIQQGWQQQLDSAQNGFGGATPNQNYLSNFFSNPNLLAPDSNPYLQQNIDNFGQNVNQQMARNQNTINQQAAQAGAFGGGRQGVAQGLNAESANDTFAEGVSRMLMDNYNQRLQQMQVQQKF